MLALIVLLPIPLSSSSSSSSRNHGVLSAMAAASEWCHTYMKTELGSVFSSVNAHLVSVCSLHHVHCVALLLMWTTLNKSWNDNDCGKMHKWDFIIHKPNLLFPIILNSTSDNGLRKCIKAFFLHSQARLITFPIIMNSSKDSSSRKCINKTLCNQKPHLLFPIIVSSTRDRGWCGKLSVSKWATVSHTARQMPSLLKKDTSYLFSPSLLYHCCHTTCFEDTHRGGFVVLSVATLGNCIREVGT